MLALKSASNACRIVSSQLNGSSSSGELPLGDVSNRDTLLRGADKLLLLHSLNATPILKLKVAHHHWVDIHWALFTAFCGASRRIIQRFAGLVMQVFHGIKHEVSIWLLLASPRYDV